MMMMAISVMAQGSLTLCGLNWQQLPEMSGKGSSLDIWELRARKQSAYQRHQINTTLNSFLLFPYLRKEEHFQCLPQSGIMNINHVNALQVL